MTSPLRHLQVDPPTTTRAAVEQACEALLREFEDRDVMIAAGSSRWRPALLGRIRAKQLLACAGDPEEPEGRSRPVAVHSGHCLTDNAASADAYATLGARNAS